MIDCHVHFWSYNKAEFPWISGDLSSIQCDRLVDDLLSVIGDKVSKVIAVQARPKQGENNFLCTLARKYQAIAGVIGWFDFDGDAELQLADAKQQSVIKGFRHLIQDEIDPSSYLREHSGLHYAMPLIQAEEFVYEILIRQKDIDAALEFCSRHDRHYLVVDHLAKPIFGDEEAFTDWRNRVLQLTGMDHVCLKISGLMLEAGGDVPPDTFRRYTDFVYETFGPERLLWGSDWPVSSVVKSYASVLDYWKIWTEHWDGNERLIVEEQTPKQIYRL
ncbi:Amidohydrolase-related [Bartonella choladocola]|uniref:amidohydrolase family protein n=1 Tax=Bartonella TaxID=773 RepID=UPI0018DBC2A7|nr:amidohydrolase family protein [Bartonella choladocola]MBI0140790.1 amidohydrolase family protein [Bartonella choladocola]